MIREAFREETWSDSRKGTASYLVDGVPLPYPNLLGACACLGGHKLFRVSDGIVFAALPQTLSELRHSNGSIVILMHCKNSLALHPDFFAQPIVQYDLNHVSDALRGKSLPAVLSSSQADVHTSGNTFTREEVKSTAVRLSEMQERPIHFA